MGKVFLQIPDYLIRNDGVNINATDFATICMLKNCAFLRGSFNLEIDHVKLRVVVGIRDVRTQKKSLISLHEAGTIINQINELPKRGPLTINLNGDALNTKPFTQLPSSILNHLEKIDHLGLRLLFYYESHIIRGDIKKQFCYSSYKTICDDLSIGESTLSKYNDLLVSNGLLSIKKSNIGTDYSYNDNGTFVYTKYNNHYTPMINKM